MSSPACRVLHFLGHDGGAEKAFLKRHDCPGTQSISQRKKYFERRLSSRPSAARAGIHAATRRTVERWIPDRPCGPSGMTADTTTPPERAAVSPAPTVLAGPSRRA